MNIKQWFLKKSFWLRGGIIGVIVCASLFLFYIFLYFPVIDKVYANDIIKYGGTPNWTLVLPMYTGHFFPFFSGFIAEGLGLGGTWLEAVVGVVLTILLFLIYFFIGATISAIIQKIKAR
jgi:hypothetical protein